MKTITQWRDDIHRLAVEKGWWPHFNLSSDEVLSRLMLIVSEVAEACEEARKYPPQVTYGSDDGKPEGFPIEIADAMIRILDLCGGLGIDIEAAMYTKHVFNKTRSFRHGGKKS